MTNTVKGRVQKVNDREDNDWFGICIDNTWYNGDDSLQKDVKGYKLKLEVDPEADFKDIRKINIIEEDNEDAQSVQDSNTGNGGEGSNSSKSSSQHLSERQAGIIATASVNQARDTVNTSYEDNKQKHLERVDELSQAYNNIMKDRMRENTQ